MLIPHSIACGATSVPPQTIALHLPESILLANYSKTSKLRLMPLPRLRSLGLRSRLASFFLTYPSANNELPISDTKSKVLRVLLQFCGFFISDRSTFFNSRSESAISCDCESEELLVAASTSTSRVLSIVVGFSMTICDIRRDQRELHDIQEHCTGDYVVQGLRGG